MEEAIKYQDYENMIWHHVNKYARSHGITDDMVKDDIKIEADLLFCKAMETYNPKRGKFSTHLYTTLAGRIPRSMSTLAYQPRLTTLPFDEEESVSYIQETSTLINEGAKELSELAYSMLDYLVDLAQQGTIEAPPTLMQGIELSFNTFRHEISSAWDELSSWFKSKKQYVSREEHIAI